MPELRSILEIPPKRARSRKYRANTPGPTSRTKDSTTKVPVKRPESSRRFCCVRGLLWGLLFVRAAQAQIEGPCLQAGPHGPAEARARTKATALPLSNTVEIKKMEHDPSSNTNLLRPTASYDVFRGLAGCRDGESLLGRLWSCSCWCCGNSACFGISTRVYVCMHACMHVCKYVYAYTYMYMYIYIYIYTCMCLC